MPTPNNSSFQNIERIMHHILKLTTATLVGLGIEQQQAATREKRYRLLHAPHFLFYLFTNFKAILYYYFLLLIYRFYSSYSSSDSSPAFSKSIERVLSFHFPTTTCSPVLVYSA